jgi:hypothetical protein
MANAATTIHTETWRLAVRAKPRSGFTSRVGMGTDTVTAGAQRALCVALRITLCSTLLDARQPLRHIKH